MTNKSYLLKYIKSNDIFRVRNILIKWPLVYSKYLKNSVYNNMTRNIVDGDTFCEAVSLKDSTILDLLLENFIDNIEILNDTEKEVFDCNFARNTNKKLIDKFLKVKYPKENIYQIIDEAFQHGNKILIKELDNFGYSFSINDIIKALQKGQFEIGIIYFEKLRNDRTISVFSRTYCC